MTRQEQKTRAPVPAHRDSSRPYAPDDAPPLALRLARPPPSIPVAEPGAPATLGPIARPTWVLIPEEARVRGFKNALAFRRWCRRRQVALRRDGKMLWVRPADVDAAVGGLPVQSTSPAVTASVEAIKARRAR